MSAIRTIPKWLRDQPTTEIGSLVFFTGNHDHAQAAFNRIHDLVHVESSIGHSHLPDAIVYWCGKKLADKPETFK